MDREDIIKLARKAGFDPHDMSDDFICNLIDIERFAELIVKECINEVEGLQVSQSTLDWSQHWNRAIAHTALHLKEHFGVEG